MQNMKLLDLQTGKYLELGERGFFYGGDTITCPPIKSFIIKGTDQCFDIYADNIDMYDIRKLNNVNTDNDVNSGSAHIFEITLKSNNQKFVGVPVSNIDDRFNRLFYKTEPQEPLKTLCEKTGAVVYGGRYVLIECLGIVCNGDIIRDIQNAGIYCKIDDNILNINDYFINDNQIYSKNSMRQQYFYKSDFSNVLKNVRTDFEYALDFFNKKIAFEYATTKREKKEIEGLIKSYMQNEPDRNLEIYYFQHKLHSGVFILGNIFEEYSRQLRNEENKFEELISLYI